MSSSIASQKNYFIAIIGPTGVGKTDFSLALAHALHGQVINMDVGQFYTPFLIGTAKPDWRNQPVRHHLFDIIDAPENLDVSDYRLRVMDLCHALWDQKETPLLVGGSGFYLKSLIFPPHDVGAAKEITIEDDSRTLWEQLHAIDPVRARAISPHDPYRIKRALAIWHASGTLPSHHVPEYDPPAPYGIIFLTRDRKELYDRIDVRVDEMMASGWLDEVRSLIDTPWEAFIKHKKLIGYNELIDHLRAPTKSLEEVALAIKKRTRNYAKRQLTFWRMLQRTIQKAVHAEKQPAPLFLDEVNLTTTKSDLYINQLSKRLGVAHKK